HAISLFYTGVVILALLADQNNVVLAGGLDDFGDIGKTALKQPFDRIADAFDATGLRQGGLVGAFSAFRIDLRDGADAVGSAAIAFIFALGLHDAQYVGE